MLTMMKRPRMYVDDPDGRLKWALRIKAAKENLPSLSDAIVEAIKSFCSEELLDVDRRMAKGEKLVQSKRGRKPKSD